MTVTYKTQGILEHPVNDLNAAREFLREHGQGMREYIYPKPASIGVHSVTWDLLDDSRWEVTLIADDVLIQAQLDLLSEWISGQNSDGLGEGFEQQPFSEHEAEDEDDGGPTDMFFMSSFDWQTNDCKLVEVHQS